MPAKVRKKKGGGYSVSTPNQVHAKDTTKEKAEAQQRLLNAVDHGWVPTGTGGGKDTSSKGKGKPTKGKGRGK